MALGYNSVSCGESHGVAMGDPTGEADKGALRLDFDRRLMLRFRGSTITSDAGLLAYRELDDTLRLTDTGAARLADARAGKNGRHQHADRARLASCLLRLMYAFTYCAGISRTSCPSAPSLRAHTLPTRPHSVECD